jgi:MFS superfamily sulfate permease-like transporter
MDIPALRRFHRVRPSAFWLSIVAGLGVVLLGVLEGIGVAVMLSVLLFFQRGWWPQGEVMGRDPATGVWHSIHSHPRAVQRPGVLVYRWEAPLFFANSGMFRDRLTREVRRSRARWVVLQCEAITDLDVTAADVLRDLDRDLNQQGIHMAFVEMRTRIRRRVESYGLYEELPEEHFFATLDAALAHVLMYGDPEVRERRDAIGEDPLG